MMKMANADLRPFYPLNSSQDLLSLIVSQGDALG